jgi:hypothetical protein
MKPQRIQLQRTKGWRMPENTVKVDRSTKWGNPFTPDMLCVSPGCKHYKQGEPIGVAGAVQAFRTSWETKLRRTPVEARGQLELIRGKNLACWCKRGQLCHADVLLELANELLDKSMP